MGRWVRRGPVVVKARIPNWSGDTGAAATSFPDDTAGAVSFEVRTRTMRLWAYSPEDGDLRLDIPFSEIVPEEGSFAGYPTGRLDTTGKPEVFFHDGQIKFLVKSYNGGGSGPSPLLRGYTNLFWETA